MRKNLSAVIALILILLNLTSCTKSGNGSSSNTIPKWSELNGLNTPTFSSGSIYCIVTDLKGNVYIGGGFANSLGKCYVSKWDGENWSELGGNNTSTFNDYISSLSIDALGNIYAGGQFTNSNGKFYVAKWDGKSWSELGTSPFSKGNTFLAGITCIRTDVQSNIYVAGGFVNSRGKCYIAKWDGKSWNELGGDNASTLNNQLNGINIDALGNVYAGGLFTNSNGKFYIAKWDGTSWSELGTSIFNGPIRTMTIDKSGNLYTASGFTNSLGSWRVNKWDGKSWSTITNKDLITSQPYTFNNPIISLITDTKGNIYAGGQFTDASSFIGNYFVAKWDGTSWSELGNSISFFNNIIWAVTTDATNNVYAAGLFSNNLNKKFVAIYK